MILFQPPISSLEFQRVPLTYWKGGPKGYIEESYPINWHSEFEFFYVVEGRGKLLLDSNVLNVSAGEIYAVNPYSMHRVYSDGELIRFYYFKFPYTLFESAKVSVNGKRLKINVTDEESLRLFKSFAESLSVKGAYASMCTVALAMSFVSYVFEKFAVSTEDEISASSSEKPRYAKCAEVMAYINTHYMERISASTISSFLGYNRSYLTREFKKYTGLTLTDYINMVRCVAAHDMLFTTEMTIARVSAACGYSDPSHFNNTYKRFFGCTPARDSSNNRLKEWIYH